MTALLFLIPVTLFMGAMGLTAFFWSLRSGQYDDLAGDAERILFDDDDTPLAPEARHPESTPKARHPESTPKARHPENAPQPRQTESAPKAQRMNTETTK